MTQKLFWHDTYLTHVKHTGEVGALELKRRNIGKGKERIEIMLM